jgi:hypothetical protein
MPIAAWSRSGIAAHSLQRPGVLRSHFVRRCRPDSVQELDTPVALMKYPRFVDLISALATEYYSSIEMHDWYLIAHAHES